MPGYDLLQFYSRRTAGKPPQSDSILDNREVSRRSWLALATSLLAGGCGRRPGSGFPGYALVATAGEAGLSVVDLAAFRTLPPIQISEPSSAIVAGLRGNAFVLCSGAGRIYGIGADRKAAQVGLLPRGVSGLLRTDAHGLLALSPETGELLQIAPGNLNVVKRWASHAQPQSVAVHGNFAVVGGGSTGTVQLIHLGSGKQVVRRLGGTVGKLHFRLDGQLLLVACLTSKSIFGLSVPDLELVAELPLPMQPVNLCANADGGQIFVSGPGMDGVAIIFPYRILQVDQTVLAGRDPGFMTASDNPKLLFVGSASGSDISILSIESRKVVAVVDVAQRPTYMTITPDNQYALILDRDANAMALIRIPAIRLNPAIVRSKSGASLFTVLSVGRAPVHAAVIANQA